MQVCQPAFENRINPAPTGDDDSSPGRGSKRGFVTAAAAGFTAFVNIYALQPVLPILVKEFQTDTNTASLTVGATTLAVALAAPFTTSLVKSWTRSGLTKIAVGGLVFAGVQVALSPSLEAMIFWRFIQGIFLPLLIAAVLAFFSEDFFSHQISRATSYYVTWSIAGGFCGRWMAGALSEGFGWRVALLTLAGLNALAGMVLLGSLRNPRSRLQPSKSYSNRLETLRRPDIRSVYLIGLGSLMTLVGVFTFITFHLAGPQFHLGPEALGRTFCVYLLGIAVTPLVGEALPKLGIGSTIRYATLLASAGLFLTLLPYLFPVVLGLSLVCVAAFGTQAAASSFIAKLEPEEKASAAGLYLSFYYLGGCLGTVLPGWAWEYSGWLGCASLLFLVQMTMSYQSLSLSPQRHLLKLKAFLAKT